MALQSNALITIFGGTGFVGRHIVKRLAKAGYRLRIATRRPNEALFLKTNGTPGQIEIVQANIRDEASTKAALIGADAVVNAVGILFESGKQKFAALQAEGAARIGALAKAEGIEAMVHISAIGADANSASVYAHTKAAGEAAIIEALPQAHILRPSIIIGPEDDFFNRFAGLALLAPALPLIGGGLTKYQPVSVFDVATAVERCLAGAPSGLYELGGPDVLSFKELMQMLLAEIKRPRLLVPLPFAVARIIGAVAQFMPKPLLTPDQVILLVDDNVVNEGAAGFDALGITPQPIAGLLPEYLYRFRPSGKK
jgi:NADH dehydrogenase